MNISVPSVPSVPQGFRLAGVHCGIKRDPNKNDVALVVCDRPAVAAGVYTKNLVFAAPVAVDRDRTPNGQIRAVVINSGNANACTGQQGLDDAHQMCAQTADAIGAKAEEVLVLSTGVIGQKLPMDKIGVGITACAEALADDHDALVSAARGMMTTDTTQKIAGRTLTCGADEIQIVGMAKGAAMIGPNMATMLGLVLTDATIDPQVAQDLLTSVVDETFNCIHVDGHMSTNDTVLLLASGAASGERLAGERLAEFRSGLHEICLELARSIPMDGEGATHLIIIDVVGCRDRDEARTIAKSVADSLLVKTAIAGADPNWGRIVSAAGYAGATFDPKNIALHVNETLLYRNGTPVSFNEATVSASIRDHRETSLRLTLAEGNASIRFWTTDLTAEYVRLNADYRT